MQIESGIIVSIQPRGGSYLYAPDYVVAVACEVAKVAVAVRIEGFTNIMSVASSGHMRGKPIIGLKKITTPGGERLITPTYSDGIIVASSGATHIAAECTSRVDYNEMAKLIGEGHLVVADVADADGASVAEDLGAIAVTTALSGYIGKTTHPFVGPDVELVEQCVKKLHIPVIAEGRYWTPKQLAQAREAGAHAVCIGGGISDISLVTLHAQLCFDGTWKEKSKNGYLSVPLP